MTRAPMGPDNPLLLGFGEYVHYAAITLRPVRLRQAMHEADIDVVGSEFLAEAVEISAGGSSVTGPGFGQDRDFIPCHVFEVFADMRRAAVRIGRGEKA